MSQRTRFICRLFQRRLQVNSRKRGSYAVEVDSNALQASVIVSMAAALNITEQQLDSLFIAAATL